MIAGKAAKPTVLAINLITPAGLGAKSLRLLSIYTKASLVSCCRSIFATHRAHLMLEILHIMQRYRSPCVASLSNSGVGTGPPKVLV